MKKFAYAWILMVLLLTGCRQDESVFVAEEDEMITVNYQVELGDAQLGRAIGDGSLVDELVVGIFRDGSLVTKLTFKDEADGLKDRKFNNIAIPMMKLETYDLVFWAQKSGNGVYSIDNNFNVNIDYTQYSNIGMDRIAEFEAFTIARKNVSVSNPGQRGIALVRPFAQLNVASSQVSGVMRTEIQVNKVYTKFHPLTNGVGDLVENPVFVFDNSFVGEKLEIENVDYWYLAMAYLLPVVDAEVKLSIYQSNMVHNLNCDDVTFETNKRTNIVGNLLN